MFMKSTLPSSPPHPLPSVRPSQALAWIIAACSWAPCLSSRISVTVAKSVGSLVSHCPRWSSHRSTEADTSGQLCDPSQPQLPLLLLRDKFCFPATACLSSLWWRQKSRAWCAKPTAPLWPGSLTVLCNSIRLEPPAPHPRSPPPSAPTPQTTCAHRPSVPLRCSPCRRQRLLLGACTNHCLFKIFVCLGACEILEGAWSFSFP